MRDHLRAAQALRTRFTVRRHALPCPPRVLLAATRPTPAGPTTTGRAGDLHVTIAPRIRLGISVRAGRHPSPPPPLSSAAAVPSLAGSDEVVHRHRLESTATVQARTEQRLVRIKHRLTRTEQRVPQAAHVRTEQRLVRIEHRLTRTEQRVPQAVQVVNRPAAPAGPAEPPAGRTTAATTTAPTLPGPSQATAPAMPAPDLTRITDHVLGVIDHRLIAYAERLGRG